MIGIGSRKAKAMRASEVGSGIAEREAVSALACGMIAGTKVATPQGWRRVEAIVEGDSVLTFDGGMQVVTGVTRGELWPSAEPCPRALWPLDVPEGALGNAQPMLLMPGQSLVIETEIAETLYGSPYTLIAASAFEGFRGIARTRPPGRVEVVALVFSGDRVVFGSAGALYFCPSRATTAMSDGFGDSNDDFVVLGIEDAAFLIGRLLDGGEADPDRSASRAGHAAFAA